MTVAARASALGAVAAAGLLAGCGGGTPVNVNGPARGVLSGRVIKGPVAQGTVTAYRLSNKAKRGEALASATTTEDGSFSITVPAYNGPILLVATGGSYVEEAVGTRVSLDGKELSRLVPTYRTGTTVGNVLVTPVSHWAVALTTRYVDTEGKDLASADGEAWQHLNAHFGALDWRDTAPSELVANPSSQLDKPATAGLILAALSMQARGIAESAGLSPGSVVNTMALVSALYEDLASDGYFDGVGPKGPIFLPEGDVAKTSKLDGQTVRLSLALASQRFLGDTEHNRSHIADADAKQLRFDLSRSSNPRLFRDSGSTYDTEPPLVSLAGAGPARYTQEASISFSVLADDGAGTGVARVLARNGPDATPVVGTPADGVWRFSGLPLRLGPNTITVWAEDKANPLNSGSGRPAPAEISFQVLVDRTSPTPAVIDVASYFDERSLEIEQSGGIPTTPPVHRFPPGATKAVLRDQGDVWKASPRLSWGGAAPTGAVLEGTNPENVPFLQVFVPHNPENEAPIQEVRFSIEVTCAGCPAFAPSTGTLIRSARTEPQRAFFDLPLVAETVPALRSLASSPAKLVVTFSARDAAGNVGPSVSATTLQYHVIGPPLAWIADGNYPAAGDPRSVYPYSLTNGNYHVTWTADPNIVSDTVGSHNNIRLARYVLRNPYPINVAVPLILDGAQWDAFERWDDEVWAHARDFSADGFSFPYTRDWLLENQPQFGELHPCVGQSGFGRPNGWANQMALHRPGSGTQYTCAGTAYPESRAGNDTSMNAFGTRPRTDAVLVPFNNPQGQGAERERATVVQGVDGRNHVVVPANGAVALYVERPLFSDRGFFNPLTWVAADAPGPAYRSIQYDVWRQMSVAQICPSGGVCANFAAQRYANRLGAAREWMTGTVRILSSGIRSDGVALGDLRDLGSHAVNTNKAY